MPRRPSTAALAPPLPRESKPGPAAASRRGRYQRTRELAEVIESVFADFDGSMSTRQVYYQAVSRGAVENNGREYDRVQRLVVDLRRDGTIPYERVVDRSRPKHHRRGWNGVEDLMQSAASQYRRDYWRTQETVVMIAVEKAALEGIFAEVVDDYGVSLWTVRGYVSDGFAFEWATTIQEFANDAKDVRVFYFGDHDPSGLDIERKIRERLNAHRACFGWERAGLLESDFDDFDLVNVPVKATDSRARGYLADYGNRAAELDALPPDVLRQRIRDCIERHIDADAWERVKRAELLEQETLAAVQWGSIVANAQGART